MPAPADRDEIDAETLARLRANLGLVARLGSTLTYAQAARSLDLAPPRTIHRITLMLEALMHEDAAAGRPFLAALVVSRARDGLPAPGFFACAARLGRYAGPLRGPEAAAYHAGERARATAFWTQRR